MGDKRRTIGYLIALAALLISIPRYIATLEQIDPNSLTAYGMGILLGAGAAYIVDAWSDAHKRNVKNTNRLLVAAGVNLIYEPILLTPFVLSQLWGQRMSQVMGEAYAVFWAIAVTAAPVILVAGVIYAISFQKQSRKTADTTTVKNEPVTVSISEKELERLFLLRENLPHDEPFSRAAAEEVLGVGTTSTNQVLSALMEAGEVTRVGRGRKTRYRFEGNGNVPTTARG